MRWFFALIKILFTVIVIAFVIKLTFVFIPNFHPISYFYERIKGFGLIENNDNAKKDNTENNNILSENVGQENKLPNEEAKPEEPGNKEKEKTNSGDSKKPGTERKKQGEYFMTFNEISSIECISVQDKLVGLSILSKLKKPDIDRILEMTEGGITMKEFEELEKILQKSLSPDEVEKLNEILLKNKKLYQQGKLARK